jgi:hypothetical protein
MVKVGVYNVVTDGFRWRRLLFYECDRTFTDEDSERILKAMSGAKSAFIVYTTSKGFHIMGLTPLSTIVWAYGFKDLDMDLGGNHSGYVLRINRKPNEVQKVVMVAGLNHFIVSDQLYSLVKRKFGLSVEENYLVGKWKSVFCLYGDGIERRLPPMKRHDKTAKRAADLQPASRKLSSYATSDKSQQVLSDLYWLLHKH